MKTIKDISKEKLSLQECLTYFCSNNTEQTDVCMALHFQGSDVSHLTAQLMCQFSNKVITSLFPAVPHQPHKPY